MTGMGTHSAAKGGPLRRAWVCAWIVTVAMGGTTMAFQVYHSLHTGNMPWSLAWLFGIMPLLIAMVILEIIAEWTAAPWAAKAVAYSVMIGAMYMSASGTGDVVQYAAPKHFSLLFGALLDAAELLAAYFIMNGPRAYDTAADTAAADAAAREAALRAGANAERSAREEAERGAAETEASLRAQLAAGQAAADTAAAQAQEALRAAAVRAESGAQAAGQAAADTAREAHRARENALLQEIDAEHHAREIAEQGASRWSAAEDGRIAAEAGRASNAGQLRSARDALEAANAGRREAESRAAQAEAKAAALTRKLDAAAGAKGPRNAGAAAGADGGRSTPATKVPSDFDAQAAALAIIAEEPDISGSKLAERVGKSERWGQTFKKNLAGHVTGSGSEGDGTAREGD